MPTIYVISREVWHRCCMQERRVVSASGTIHRRRTYRLTVHYGYVASHILGDGCGLRAGNNQVHVLHIAYCYIPCTHLFRHLYPKQTQPGSPSEPGGCERTAVAVKSYAPRAIGITADNEVGGEVAPNLSGRWYFKSSPPTNVKREII